MKKEQLIRAKVLEKEIEALEKQKEKYENAVGIYDIRFAKYEDASGDYFGNVWSRFIDFEVLKTLALKKINEELKQLETEFENL